MRVPDPSPRPRHLALAAFALLLAIAGPLAAQAPAPAPGPLADYDRFELADVELATDLLGPDGNEHARRELRMHLRDRLGPWLEQRNRQPARGTPPRALRIEPTIVALAYVDPAVRIAVGPMVGGEHLHVRVRFVDVATGRVAAETELRADGSMLMNVSSLGATASALPRQVAADLADFLEAGVTAAPAADPDPPH